MTLSLGDILDTKTICKSIKFGNSNVALFVMAVGFTFLVTGVLGYRASFKTEDEDKKNIYEWRRRRRWRWGRQWFFGIVGFVGSLMMVVAAVHFACWEPTHRDPITINVDIPYPDANSTLPAAARSTVPGRPRRRVAVEPRVPVAAASEKPAANSKPRSKRRSMRSWTDTLLRPFGRRRRRRRG